MCLLYKKNVQASAAVEFSFVIFPFLIIVLGIIETSYNYYIQQRLDDTVVKVANQVRFGTAQSDAATMNAATFYQNYVVPNLPSTITTSGNNTLIVNVMKITPNAAATGVTYTNADGATVTVDGATTSLAAPTLTSTSTFCPGVGGNFVLVQLVYGHQNITSLMNPYFSSIINSTNNTKGIIFSSTTIVKNEPFSGSSAAGC